jgi:hypothetical protein
MRDFLRYAIYYAPQPGAFADRAAAWLGWDLLQGRAVARPNLTGLPRPLADLTRAPAKYGFHGTIRAPFRSAVGEARLIEALVGVAATLSPVHCDELALRDLDGFLALIPQGRKIALAALAETVMRATDSLRAPLTAEEISRRRPGALTPRQRDLMLRWGYPFVMEEFHFHLTLTDRLAVVDRPLVAAALAGWMTPVVPVPFVIKDLCLVGEDGEGRFHLRYRATLSG